jgi:hypothetical protein
MLFPKSGDYVIYNLNSCYRICLAKIHEVTLEKNTVHIKINNFRTASSATMPLSLVQYLIPSKFMPSNFKARFDYKNGFYPFHLCTDDIEYIINHMRTLAATIIQQRIKHHLYSVPNGTLFIQLCKKWETYKNYLN